MNAHPGVVAIIGCALLCAVGILFSVQRRLVRGGGWFTGTLLASTIWSLTEAAEALAPATDDKILWGKLSYLGSATLAVFWFMFALRYQERNSRISSRIVPLFFVIPVATICAVMTNEFHHLIWTSITRLSEAKGGNLVYGHGPAFWVFIFYTYILLATSILFFANGLRGQSLIERQRNGMILAGLLVPVLGNSVYIAGLFSFGGMDPTPSLFGISGMLLLFALTYRRQSDLSPIVRATLIEQMNDGLLVLDEGNRVVDINPAARRLLNLPAEVSIGQEMAVVLSSVPELLALCATEEREGEIQVSGTVSRYVQVHLIPVGAEGAELTGRMMTLRDVSASRQSEVELRRLNARLQEQLGEIKELRDKLQEQANRDPLTGLYNRRYFLEMLDYFLAAGRHPISLVMLDVDYFKQINDEHGHLAGDAVLGSLADLLREQVRSPEFACRYGGEEFLVVLPGTSIAQAGERAERWRTLFQADPVLVRGLTIQSTLSIGIAASPEHGIYAEGLVHSADMALYAAKEGGRNRVVLLPTNIPLLAREPMGNIPGDKSRRF